MTHPRLAALGTLAPRAADPTPVANREAFARALVELGQRDPRVVVLDGDLANSTKTDAFGAAFPERFFEMGIAEQNMVGAAAGMAAAGLVPFAATFAVFLASRALDQARMVVAQTKLHVVLCGTYAGLLIGRAGKTHLCLDDVAIFRALPNMTILAPGDAVETRLAVLAAAQHPGPVYLRTGRDAYPTVFDAERHRLEIGRAVFVRPGHDVALLTSGLQLSRTLEAADLLAGEGIEAMVLHFPTVKPLDEDAVVAAAELTGAIVTAEDHSIIGGLGSAVAEVLGERHPAPLRRVGMRDVFGESGPNEALLEKYGMTARHVAAAAREAMAARDHGASPRTTAAR